MAGIVVQLSRQRGRARRRGIGMVHGTVPALPASQCTGAAGRFARTALAVGNAGQSWGLA